MDPGALHTSARSPSWGELRMRRFRALQGDVKVRVAEHEDSSVCPDARAGCVGFRTVEAGRVDAQVGEPRGDGRQERVPR